MSETSKVRLVELLSEVQSFSVVEPRSLIALGLKATEEAGELAEEILIACGESPNKIEGEDGVTGESVDLALVALSIFFKNGGSIDDFIETSTRKMKKWNESIQMRA